MKEWLEQFYGPSFTASLLKAFGPLFASYASAVWTADGGTGEPPEPFVAALTQGYVDHHRESSRIQLLEIADQPDTIRQRIAEWIEKRPAKVAANETVRAGNALALEQMRSSGVTRKVWRSSGSSCPYCKSMNGRSVAVEQDFFTPDDSYQPEGAETPLTFTSSVGHPPIHQGCDCSIVAE